MTVVIGELPFGVIFVGREDPCVRDSYPPARLTKASCTRCIGSTLALVTICSAVRPLRGTAGDWLCRFSVGIHCIAIAAAIPAYVRLRFSALVGLGMSVARTLSLPWTSLLGTKGGRFFRYSPVGLVCP